MRSGIQALQPIRLLVNTAAVAGGASVKCNKIRLLGQKVVVVEFVSDTAPAAGFPRVRQSTVGDGTWDDVYTIPRDTNQANFTYKAVVPIYLPYVAVEWTQGAVASTFTRCNVFALPIGEPQQAVDGSSGGLNPATDPITDFGPTPSNGATAVTLGPASAASTRVYMAKVSIENTDTVAHTVTFQSSGGTFKREFYMPPLSEITLDEDNGWLRSQSGEAFQAKIDAAGSATSVRFSGQAVQK